MRDAKVEAWEVVVRVVQFQLDNYTHSPDVRRELRALIESMERAAKARSESP